METISWGQTNHEKKKEEGKIIKWKTKLLNKKEMLLYQIKNQIIKGKKWNLKLKQLKILNKNKIINLIFF